MGKAWAVAVATMTLLAGAPVAASAATPGIGAQAIHVVTTGADSGSGSFRDAITAANSDVDPVQIVFDPGLTVTLTSGEVAYTNTQPIEILGNGSTINRTTVTSRILNITAGAPLTVTGLTFTNGGPNAGAGGAIFSSGAVTISGSSFIDNAANGSLGGAIAANGVTITSSTFTGNDAGFSGAVDSVGVLTITDSTFVENTASNSGGAVTASDALTVTGSTFDRNTAGNSAGAVLSDDATMITGSTFTGNTAPNTGGIFAFGPVTVVGSSFTGNRATTSSIGAIFSFQAVTITGSTFSANSAVTTGGAIIAGGTLTATNSTFSGNSAGGGTGAIFGTGVVLVYATFGDNSAPAAANIASALGLTSFGSVISGPLGGGTSCAITGATTSSYSYAADASCSFTGTGDTQNGADPQLLALQGSPTAVRPPAETSPLVDAIPVAACDATVTTDQRGVTRPRRAGCDIGAVELEELEEPQLIARFAG